VANLLADYVQILPISVITADNTPAHAASRNPAGAGSNGCEGSRTGNVRRLASFDQKRTEFTPGTVLVREWDRQSQRVMVMADGFAWNGQTYDSLSKVAFAITGTKWNGPRFFGLMDKGDRHAMEARP